MNKNLPHNWQKILQDEFQKPYFRELAQFITNEYEQNACWPQEKQLFSAFEHCSFDEVKVVILGQDPYHGEGQSHGLCFSVREGIKTPPSLRNIFKEIETDIGKPVPSSGNLDRWAKQGVLLLNATLSVRQGEPGSHKKHGWEQFTDAVIEKLSEEKEHVVFLLWGGLAKKKGAKIDREKHLVLSSGHPSPLSAIRGHWFGNRHFSIANEYLKENRKAEIDW